MRKACPIIPWKNTDECLHKRDWLGKCLPKFTLKEAIAECKLRGNPDYVQEDPQAKDAKGA